MIVELREHRHRALHLAADAEIQVVGVRSQRLDLRLVGLFHVVAQLAVVNDALKRVRELAVCLTGIQRARR